MHLRNRSRISLGGRSRLQLAFSAILVWGISGPLFGFNDTWQLVINTATTIVTFLMVFVIQNTQNRDTVAMQIKLDELIRVSKSARNALLDLEELDDKTLETLRRDYEKLASQERLQKAPRGRRSAGTRQTVTGAGDQRDRCRRWRRAEGKSSQALLQRRCR